MCTEEGEHWPCFNGSKLDKDGKIDHLFKIDFLAGSCCSAACSEQEIREYFCCRSDECLLKCYDKSTPDFEARLKERLRRLALERLRMWEKFYPGSKPPPAFSEPST
ncbi:hypothetical protein AAVH_31434 [Aphelenchoides avenae]|nr:hypothetical protein AAVH_31434 [Aphelenchus avenae]